MIVLRPQVSMQLLTAVDFGLGAKAGIVRNAFQGACLARVTPKE